MDDAKRTAGLKLLSAKVHVHIKRVVKFSGDEPMYRLETDVGAVDLCDVRGLIGQAKLRNSIAACTGLYLPNFKQKTWSKYAAMLLNVCEDVDRGLDATKG